MASSDGLALAALIAGLAALVIASGQLIQQMFSTADGYRRCRYSVIGPWARKTRLVWHWNQFRFETRFTTPEIVLYDWRALEGFSKANSLRKPPFNGVPKGVIDLDGQNLPPELQDTIRPSNPDEGFNTSGDMVSWTSLLRQLYLLQAEWYQSYHQNLLPPKDTAQIVGYGTKLGVIYRERTWDLMPPESIRPMASSRLGTIIVLAIRLGMTWENLNVGDGVLRAEGNGHTLLSTMMRGFGIVFQYNFNPDMNSMRPSRATGSQHAITTQRLIPRRSTDMMCCGIVPGVAAFNIPAISLTGKNVSDTASLLSSLLLWLNVSRSTISKIVNVESLEHMQQQGYDSPVGWAINDTIALLTAFQPLKGSTNTHIAYPIKTNVALSAFLLSESREIFLHRLRHHPRLPDHDSMHLQEVHSKLQGIEQKYQNDFYCKWDQAIVNDPSATIETRISFIEDLRQIYDWTTQYFLKIQANLKFVELVAAHITLATNAGFEAHKNHKDDKDAQAYWKATASLYVDNISSLIAELRPKVFKRQNQNQEFNDHAIEEAWWTLLLRGIVWRMSIYVSHVESIVPSRLYYDQTPVYVM